MIKLKLKEPFKTIYKHGYLTKNNQNRKIVMLYKNDKERTTIQYAKYIMSVKIGRILKREEEIDHIDNNKTNDKIENLQIMTGKENRKKYKETLKGITYTEINCNYCKRIKKIKKGNSNLVKSKEKNKHFCCRKCLYMYQTKIE